MSVLKLRKFAKAKRQLPTRETRFIGDVDAFFLRVADSPREWNWYVNVALDQMVPFVNKVFN